MRYLLDELHCYENDYSDALGPTPREADVSFAGEAALIRPALTEALRMAHASLTADVAALHSVVLRLTTSQAAMLEQQAAMSERQAVMAEDMSDLRRSVRDLSDMVQVALVPHTSPPRRDANDVRVASSCKCTLLMPPCHKY